LQQRVHAAYRKVICVRGYSSVSNCTSIDIQLPWHELANAQHNVNYTCVSFWLRVLWFSIIQACPVFNNKLNDDENCMTESSMWKHNKQDDKLNAMKTTQGKASVWSPTRMEPIPVASTYWIYTSMNRDQNMDPKMGPHLGLKTGAEKVKANSRASLFSGALFRSKNGPKNRAIFWSLNLAKTRLTLTIFIIKP
jgi:hypothetical protein